MKIMMIVMTNRHFFHILFWSNVEVQALQTMKKVNFPHHLCDCLLWKRRHKLFSKQKMWKGCKLKLKKIWNTFRRTIFYFCAIPVALNSKLPHAFLSHDDVDWFSESITCHSRKRNKTKESAWALVSAPTGIFFREQHTWYASEHPFLSNYKNSKAITNGKKGAAAVPRRSHIIYWYH